MPGRGFRGTEASGGYDFDLTLGAKHHSTPWGVETFRAVQQREVVYLRVLDLRPRGWRREAAGFT